MLIQGIRTGLAAAGILLAGVMAAADFHDDFAGAPTGWEDPSGLASAAAGAGPDGSTALQIQLPSGMAAGSVHRFFAVPDGEMTRRFRYECAVRNPEAGGEMAILLLKTFADRAPEWYYLYDTAVALVAPGEGWARIDGEFDITPEVRSVGFYWMLKNAEPGGKTVWVDDFSVAWRERGIAVVSAAEGHVFAAETGELQLRISDPAAFESGTVVLREENGVVLQELALPEQTATFAVALPERGYYELTATGRYADGSQVSVATSATVAGELPPPEEWARSPFGMSGSGELFRKAGARWGRLFFELSMPECVAAARGGYATAHPSPVHAALPEMEPIYAYWPQPYWLQQRPADQPYEPGDVKMYPLKPGSAAEFRRLIAWAIQATGSEFTVTAISNEPQWHGTGEEFIDYVRLYADAVRQAKPGARIIGPCHCDINLHELRRYAELGLFELLDGLDMHAYVKGTAPEGEFIALVRALKEFMASIGHADLPIYLTEFGWCTPPGDWQTPVDFITQARYCSRSLALLAAEEIEAMLYFGLRWGDVNNGAYGYGLVNWDWTPKPAYAAYCGLTRALTGFVGAARQLQLTPTTYALVFRKKAGAVLMMWDSERALEVPLPTNAGTVRSMTGRPLRPVDGRLVVTPSPVYVELPEDGLHGMAVGETLEMRQGETRSLPWLPDWTPPGLTVNNGMLAAAWDTPLGDYLLLRRSNGGWEGQAVRVVAPAVIRAARLNWPEEMAYPGLEGTVLSHLTAAADLQLEAVGLGPASTIHTKPGVEEAYWHGLPRAAVGTRQRGWLTVRDAAGAQLHQLAYDVTVLPVYGPDGDHRWIDLGAWAGSGELRARMRLERQATGLGMTIEVEDDAPVRRHGAREMWQDDSVQIAFDFDADLPWRANHGGYQGHRAIFEYGVAAGPECWRWLSYDPQLPADCAEERLAVAVEWRQGVTTYELFFPWAVLGRTAEPRIGTSFGLAVTINDVDDDGAGRRTLNFFDGIENQKNPMAYGRLYWK